jgi:HAD superfamily hydrolase (TIGR01459 family)
VTRFVAGLAEIAPDFDVLLCDVWGVIHDGVRAFPEPCATLVRWRAERGPVILISNAPRPAESVAAQLDALGVPRAAWTELATSGDVTRELLSARAPGPAWRIGPAKDEPLFEGLGLDYAPPETARFIACTGPERDDVETPDDYRAPLAVAAARSLEMICANPDKVVQRGDRLVYCGGALADLYEQLGGGVIMAGKPFAPIYSLALERAGSPAARTRVLALGDGPGTDIAGANAFGLPSLFVTGGVHGAELSGADGGLDRDRTLALLGDAGVRADFAMPRLRW